jgi:hypothetical protein
VVGVIEMIDCSTEIQKIGRSTTMTCNPKTLGLALAAVLASGAIAASAAQAEKPAQLTAEAGTVKIDGNQTKPGTLVRLARKFTCEKFEVIAAAANGATTIEGVVPVFAVCKDEVVEKPVTINMNGCTFTFHLTADAKSPEDTWTMVWDLACPAGPALFTIYNNAGHTEVLCKYHFPAQTGKVTTDLTNIAAGTKVNGITTPRDFLIAHVNIGAIKSIRTEGSAVLCGAEVNETMTWSVEMHLWGTNAAKEITGITISTK